MKPMTHSDLPFVIDVVADATAVGKSFTATCIRDFLDNAGIPNLIVRIETRGVRTTLREGDVYIPVEDFAEAASRPGGIAGVLQPLSTAIIALQRTRRVVIVDWGGGLARHHLEYLAKTHLDTMLPGLGIGALVVVVTTTRTEHMREAEANLRQLADIAPHLGRCLLLNERFGRFKFLDGSHPARIYGDLLRAARGSATIKLQAVVGDSWKPGEDAQMTMPEMIASTPQEFAEKTGLDFLTAAACLTEVATFWRGTEKEISRVLRFRPAA